MLITAIFLGIFMYLTGHTDLLLAYVVTELIFTVVYLTIKVIKD